MTSPSESPGLPILIATGNPHKLEEIGAVLEPLGFRAIGLNDIEGGSDIPEPVEDADTFIGNATIKARAYAKATGRMCLADDSGLIVGALKGEPGVHSAYYAGHEGSRAERDARNNAKLLDALDGVPEAQRDACFTCVMVLCAPSGEILASAEGHMPGTIGTEPRGDNGFGYDPLLILEGDPDGRTSAQLSPDEKNARSHRGQATRAIAPKIAGLLRGLATGG